MFSEAAEKEKHVVLFRQVVDAFNTLKDPIERSIYDGKLKIDPHHAKPNKPNKPSNHEEDSRYKYYPSEPMHVNCAFFQGTDMGRCILTHLQLTEAERAAGGIKSVTIKKRVLCEQCIGDGFGIWRCPVCHNDRDAKYSCWKCDYTGSVQSACPRCKGSGLSRRNRPYHHCMITSG